MTEAHQTSIFDFLAAKTARDQAIAHVIANGPDWHSRALQAVAALPRGWRGIGEDIRKHVMSRGVSAPHHPNCWGALIMAAHRAGYLKRAEGWQNAKAKKSHACSCPIIERV
jgi:hypothetical protein